jgi:hypothetical protein
MLVGKVAHNLCSIFHPAEFEQMITHQHPLLRCEGFSSNNIYFMKFQDSFKVLLMEQL